MLTMPLAVLAYFSIAWALIRCRPGRPEHTLSVWVLTYVVPLSMAVTKIENFVFAVMPAIALLVPRLVETLLRKRQFGLVLALCISTAAAYILPRVTEIGPGWTLLAFGGILAVVRAVLFLVGFQSRIIATSVLALTSVALFSLYVHKDVFANMTDPEDSRKQSALQQTGLDLKSLVDRNSLVLVHNPAGVKEAFLYLMYWSGVDVLDVCRPVSNLAKLRGRKELYLITEADLPYTTIGILPVGKLYSLEQVPVEVWGPAVSGACQ
jgi:membrane protein implicated in regulation of membrane protease activity